MITLGIETSCDETAVALVRDGVEILSSIVLSQVASHRPFGGVVPEIAAREHVRNILPVIASAEKASGVARQDIDLVAVTERPGLKAALLSGLAAADAIALALGIPVVGVNHIEAHLVAPFLAAGREPIYPLVSLVVSGGHTHLFLSEAWDQHTVLGATLDDAAGEAFDKVAKMLHLAYPGGPAIEASARTGDAAALALPRPLLSEESLDFSFSGLKTAVSYACLERAPNGRPTGQLRAGVNVPDVAASFQRAVVDVLDTKVRRALKQTGVKRLALGGGVACNGPLRERLRSTAEELGVEFWLAPGALCTDNAAMVAARGYEVYTRSKGEVPPLSISSRATWPRLPASVS
jgi:N6-L-threonylcarbamoyladenine synthase